MVSYTSRSSSGIGFVVTISSGAEVVTADGKMDVEEMEDIEDDIEGTEMTMLGVSDDEEITDAVVWELWTTSWLTSWRRSPRLMVSDTVSVSRSDSADKVGETLAVPLPESLTPVSVSLGETL